jgi:hypothetical protein
MRLAVMRQATVLATLAGVAAELQARQQTPQVGTDPRPRLRPREPRPDQPDWLAEHHMPYVLATRHEDLLVCPDGQRAGPG